MISGFRVVACVDLESFVTSDFAPHHQLTSSLESSPRSGFLVMSWANVKIVRDGLLLGVGINREQEVDQIYLLRLAVAGRQEHRVCGLQVLLPAWIVEQILERFGLTVMQVRCAQREAVQ
jgi:hypothetical protein